MASQQPSELEGVQPDGVYNGGGQPTESFHMEVGSPSSDEDAAQQAQPILPDLMRATQQELMQQIQAGRLTPTNVQGGEAQTQEGRPANITVNHTYNIHYQSDRPSPEHERDVEAYGNELAGHINAQSLDIVRVDTTLPMRTLQQPNFLVEPRLEVVRFFSGQTGIDGKAEYIPDAKYRKNFKRKLNGKEINLRQLHERVDEDEDCRHVCLIGNPGCGKTVLIKRYTRMVLNRQIPELDDVEVVHFMKVPELSHGDRKYNPSELMIERVVRAPRDNVFKYGYQWMKLNPEKILFVFDQADRVVTRFNDPCVRVNYSMETLFHILFQNILTDHLFPGCRTLTATRDYAWRDVKGDSRPQKFVAVGRLQDEHKVALVKAVCPGLQGQEFALHLDRHFPAALSLADDAMHLYFSIASLQLGCRKRISNWSDCVLVQMSLENMLRSLNCEREIVHKMPKLKKVAHDLIEKGKMRFTYCDMENQNPPLEYEDFHDLVVVTPQHTNYICYRLLEYDFSFFFPHQIIQEVLAASWVGESDFENFKKFLTEKLNLPRWSIVRKFLCSMLLNKHLTNMNTYFFRKPADLKNKAAELLSSLQKSVNSMDGLSSHERMELLASLFEGGEEAASLFDSIHRINLPDLILEPPDVYILSGILRNIRQLQEADICLGDSVDEKEFADFVELLSTKTQIIRLNLARLNVNQEGFKDAMNVIGERGMRVRSHRSRDAQQRQKIHLLVSTNTTGVVFQNLQRLGNEYTEVTVERVLVPCDETNAEEMN